MMFPRVGIRARIAGGSLIIALLSSIVAGIVINSQVERIVREGTSAVLQSDRAPYVAALETEPGETFDAPGPAQLVAVVGADGATPVNTLPDELTQMLPELVQSDSARDVTTTDGQRYVVSATGVDVGGRDLARGRCAQRRRGGHDPQPDANPPDRRAGVHRHRRDRRRLGADLRVARAGPSAPQHGGAADRDATPTRCFPWVAPTTRSSDSRARSTT